MLNGSHSRWFKTSKRVRGGRGTRVSDNSCGVALVLLLGGHDLSTREDKRTAIAHNAPSRPSAVALHKVDPKGENTGSA